MTKFTNFFTRKKKSPFTYSNNTKLNANNNIKAFENPYSKKTANNYTSPLNMRVYPKFEIGEKVYLKYYSVNNTSHYGIIRDIHVEEYFNSFYNKMVKDYTYDFEPIPSGPILKKSASELQKIRQDGGNKRRGRRSRRRRTHRRRH